MPEPTVFVVDDDPAVRDALRCLLESNDFQVETFASPRDFLEAYTEFRPGCLILDVQMPGMTGLALQKKLAEDKVGLPIIMLTAHANVPMAVTAMQEGAVDFIEKPFVEEDLLERIAKAFAHERGRTEEREQCAAILEKLSTLTPREREILDLFVDGKSAKQVAAALGTSYSTVRNQRASIMEKMQADSIAELVKAVLLTRQAD
jgi:RNA polymerase sigma factor (sigma-70 family)